MGKCITELQGRELYAHRQCFGMLFQNSALFDDQNVFELGARSLLVLQEGVFLCTIRKLAVRYDS